MAPLSDDLSARLTAALAGRYEIQRELGAGGMAIVFLASDVRHRRQVAIKVLRPELGTVKGPERFLREIGIAAMLVHPNIVPLFDSGEADGLPYYVMPYVAGESLKDRLRRETQLPLDDALHIACQVAEALAYAHDRGVLHRDIKPANILLSGGDALVADFGLARAIGALDSEDLTRTGLALGTPLYMSPEQASAAGALDGRTDVYSLACVLYEMLVGTPPFNGATPGAILARHSLEPVPSMRVVRSTIPAQVERAVARALAKTPADRFATARQFAQALEIARDPQGARWSWLGVTLPGGRRAARTAAAAVMIAVVATLAVVTWQRAHAPSPPDSHALAVLPFRRAQSGAGVAAGLARDLAALVAQRLPGTGGVRAIDAATVAAALARVGTGDTVVPTVADARRVGREVGAGRLLVGDIRRDGDRLVVGATVLATADGAVVVRTDEVAGPADRLAGLADRLAAEILARAAGESGERLRTLLGTSLPALRAYLAGQEALERGAFTEAARRFGEALDADSTFPLAALGMYAAGPFLSETLQLRGSQAAWADAGASAPTTGCCCARSWDRVPRNPRRCRRRFSTGGRPPTRCRSAPKSGTGSGTRF